MAFFFIRTLIFMLSMTLFFGTNISALAGNENIAIMNWSREKLFPVYLSEQRVVLIHLPEAERIRAYALGDEQSFTVSLLGESAPNIFTVHPKNNASESNLSVVGESGRSYHFLLKKISSNSTETPHYGIYVEISEAKNSVKIETDNDTDIPNAFFPRVQKNTTVESLEKSGKSTKIFTDYRLFGDKELAPSKVYDDGKYTYFDFRDKLQAKRLVALYQVIDGEDVAVNSRFENGLLIAEAISTEGWSLKNGARSICVRPSKKRK